MSDAYQYIVNHSRDFITLIDRDYRYTLVNDAYCSAIGRDRDETLNRTVAEVWGADRFEESIRERLDACFAGEEVHFIEEFRFGTVRKRLHVSFYPYTHDGEQSALVFSHDISRLADTESRLAHFEYRDRTTGLYNRRSLQEMLPAELDRARRADSNQDESRVAVLFVSLHSFRAINQTHGHHIGDLLLEHTGNRIREVIRTSDLIFRFDGTNLVVVLTRVARPTDAALVAQKLSDEVAVPYQFRGQVIKIVSYTGIALYPDNAENADVLIQRANSTSIDAEDRSIPFLFFDAQMHDLALDRMSRLSDLHAAIAAGALEVYYQPIVVLSGDEPRVVGAEALMRWRHPERGLLEPDAFLELAEDSRLIVAIDKWVLFQTIRELASLVGRYDLFLTMNVSAREFGDEDLPEIVAGALAQYPEVKPERIKLELTERGAMANPQDSLRRMQQLHEMGTEIWIDDFGSGQSSLTYLKELPATTLKIDRKLIEGIESREDERRYLSGIVETICARGRQIVVEGVESGEQARIVRELGCGYAQGFWFGAPVNVEGLRAFVAKGLPGKAAPCRRV